MIQFHPDQPLSDHELHELIASGSVEDFSRLYDVCSPTIYGIVLKILENGSLAEEVLIQTFLRIQKEAHTYNPRIHSPILWMLGIAIQQVLKQTNNKQHVYATIRKVVDQFRQQTKEPNRFYL